MAIRDLSRLNDLEVRLYRLITRSHLRIGAGEGSADVAVENPIIRALIFEEGGTEKRVPYIPGSSLHGVVRAWVEKAVRSGQQPLTGDDLKARVEGIQDTQVRKRLLAEAGAEFESFLGRKLEGDQELYDHWQVYTQPHVCNPLSDVDKCERISLQEGEPRAWKVAWWKTLGVAPPCAVCRIFGYMGQRGRVKFTHAWPTTEQPPLDVITRVAINRLTGAADEGKLFDLEAIPPGVSFYFFVVMENMEGNKARFELGLKALGMGLAGLGAHSTVGFGMVDVQREFKAVIAPQLFERDVEKEFIQPTLAGKDLKTLTDLDEEKVPRFFRALVAAHAKGKSFDSLIRFE
jgi:CRISPR/Cas system CSM-associated protein Csm3 (group 7 of RAMP superfamily)